MDSRKDTERCGPLRYLIRCRRSRLEQQGKSDVQLVEKLTKRLKLDADKVVHVATVKGPRRVHIVVDYDNPAHKRCPVRAFKGNSLKDIHLPGSAVDYLHFRVDRWNDMSARCGGGFPVQEGDHVGLPPDRRNGSSTGESDGAPKPDNLDDIVTRDVESGKRALSKSDDGPGDVLANDAERGELGDDTAKDGPSQSA